jgi:hypothetical protein
VITPPYALPGLTATALTVLLPVPNACMTRYTSDPDVSHGAIRETTCAGSRNKHVSLRQKSGERVQHGTSVGFISFLKPSHTRF